LKKKSSHELKNGILYLKGGDLTEELKTYTNVQVLPLNEFFEEKFFETKKLVYLPLKNRQ
jgi:16S rRNA (guanine527-N7)-methyltransferase